jgi:hypothetical protein
MELVLRYNQTGLNNFMDVCDCPIAAALKNAGFVDVVVGPDKWHGTVKKRIRILFIFKYRSVKRYTGVIPAEINELAQNNWAKIRSFKDIKFELPDYK